jgi:hypothetical protein
MPQPGAQDGAESRCNESDIMCLGHSAWDTDEIVDATEGKKQISRATSCNYIGRDADGDILIAIGNYRTVIYSEDIDKSTLEWIVV